MSDSSPDPRLARALAQQLASLSAAGVEQIGRGQVVEHVAPAAAPGPAAVADPAPAPPAAATPSTLAASNAESELPVLAQEVAACTKCDELCANRTQTVFGVGNPNARLCFFGEAPGADEDRLGEPFVGQAGQLLTKIIGAMGLQRSDVYILNVLKCRPPGNRNPSEEEVANCRHFFERQLAIIQPEFICCLGAVAAQNLLNTETSIGRLRGKFHEWNGYQVLATYHPAYLLRNPDAKKKVWQDMQILMSAMGIK